jgi:hypothetical protein
MDAPSCKQTRTALQTKWKPNSVLGCGRECTTSSDSLTLREKKLRYELWSLSLDDRFGEEKSCELVGQTLEWLSAKLKVADLPAPRTRLEREAQKGYAWLLELEPHDALLNLSVMEPERLVVSDTQTYQYFSLQVVAAKHGSANPDCTVCFLFVFVFVFVFGCFVLIVASVAPLMPKKRKKVARGNVEIATDKRQKTSLTSPDSEKEVV